MPGSIRARAGPCGRASPNRHRSSNEWPSDMLHHVGDVVKGRVAIDLVFRRFEQRTTISWIAGNDRGRRHYPQAHAFEAPGIGVARVAERELRVRSMNAANVAMAKTTLRTDKHLPKRPI